MLLNGPRVQHDSLVALSWNLRWNSGRHAGAQAALLDEADWDVAMLQEVSPRAWAALEAQALTAGAISAFDVEGHAPDGKRPHGAVLLPRNGLTLSNAEPITGLPRPGRGIGAQLEGWTVPVAVATWHAPNAAASGPAIKMQGYLGFLGWIARQQAAVCAGFDANHWEQSEVLELATPVNPRDRWYLENRFFGADPPHRLRDSYRDFLRRNPEEYRRVAADRAGTGCLAVSYVRGSKANPTEDRFDYIFTSEELACVAMTYDYEAGTAAGSDHAVARVEFVAEGPAGIGRS